MSATTAPAHDVGAGLERVSTLCELVQDTARRCADQPALRPVGSDEAITWGTYARRVEAIAGGLVGLGVGRGDAVAPVLANRPEFNLVDTAAMHLGATPFSVYLTLPAEASDPAGQRRGQGRPVRAGVRRAGA